MPRFDARRFRMNVIVEPPGRGFVEDEWLGRTLAIGDDVQIGVALPEALARHNRIDVAGALYPCAGVYAVAEATGAIRSNPPDSGPLRTGERKPQCGRTALLR